MGVTYNMSLNASEGDITLASRIALATGIGDTIAEGGDNTTGRAASGRTGVKSSGKGRSRSGGNEGEDDGELHFGYVGGVLSWWCRSL